MALLTENCASCGIRLTVRGVTTFHCPGCGETTMGRCPQCRDQSVVYECESCGFRGP